MERGRLTLRELVAEAVFILGESIQDFRDTDQGVVSRIYAFLGLNNRKYSVK